MTDHDPTTGPLQIVLRRSQWRDVARAADQLPTGYDVPGLDALLTTLAEQGVMRDFPDVA